MFRAATSPSDLHVKYQDSSDSDDQEPVERTYYHSGNQPSQPSMVCLPASLVSDLQFLTTDYKQISNLCYVSCPGCLSSANAITSNTTSTVCACHAASSTING